jgi:hypothetical protein
LRHRPQGLRRGKKGFASGKKGLFCGKSALRRASGRQKVTPQAFPARRKVSGTGRKLCEQAARSKNRPQGLKTGRKV